MVKQNHDKCKPSGKDRDDRVLISKNRFDTLSIDVQHPGTAILLLKSQEHAALVTAAAALSKYGSKSSENLQTLFDLNIVDLVLPLTRHEDIFTRRFATKLLAEMSTLKSVRNFLLHSGCYIPYFTDVLITDTDIFIHEFVTLILSELSKDMFGIAQILKHRNNFDFLFQLIGSPDPDVKKNSIEIMYNLLTDPIAAQAIVNTKGFSFFSIYELLKQPYPAIQLLTLDVISSLTARNKDEDIQELFRVSRGVQTLLDMLEKDESDDLRQKLLKTLSSACDNQQTADLLSSTGGVQKILQYVESFDKEFTVDFFDIIARLANSTDGRKELYKHRIVPHLLNLLPDSSHSDAAGISCTAIARMLRYGPAAEEIALANPILNILGFLKNENAKQSVRHAAIYCLAELLAADAKNCYNLLETKEQSYLLRIMKQPVGKVPLEIQMTGLQCLAAIGSYPEFRERITDVDLIDALLARIRRNNDASVAEYKIACCHALAIFCIGKTARDIFIRLAGPKTLYNLLLDSESVPVRDAAAQLIVQLSTDPVIAPQLILAGCLEYMVRHRSTSRIVPSWQTCISALMNSYLPAKFALTGHLSLHDITKSGFYVMQRNTCPFRILDQLFTLDINSMQTTYTCNFAEPYRPASRISQVGRNSVTSELEKNTRSKSINQSDGIFSIYNDDVTKAIAGEQYGKLKPDPHLHNLIKLFKCKLIAAEPKAAYEQERSGLVNISYIKSRARMLGEFVVRQMSGPDPSIKCINHRVELHLHEIKADIGTNIIPMGRLRVGSYLERALLFKVIADRISLPAALVRGDYGKTWIEIALPEIERPNDEEIFPGFSSSNIGYNNESIKTSRSFTKSISIGSMKKQRSIDGHLSSILPTELLRPNYLVDLMEDPGELIPLGTKRADEYCGLP